MGPFSYPKKRLSTLGTNMMAYFTDFYSWYAETGTSQRFVQAIHVASQQCLQNSRISGAWPSLPFWGPSPSFCSLPFRNLPQVYLWGLDSAMWCPGQSPTAKTFWYILSQRYLMSTIFVLFVRSAMSSWTKTGVSSDYIMRGECAPPDVSTGPRGQGLGARHQFGGGSCPLPPSAP